MADANSNPPTEAVSPSGINHLVLNVRDIEESHKFWTEIVGFKQVGELHGRPDRPIPPKMRLRLESAATECDPLDCGKLSISTLVPSTTPSTAPPIILEAPR